MNIKAGFKGIVRFYSLIFVILSVCPLAGQQVVSPPVITVVSPLSADSLNNTGVITVSAEIISAEPLQAFRIIHNSGTVVNEAMMKPEKKDEKTYVISSFVPLRKGINTISVEAKNSGGMVYSETRTINSHLEPFITWLSPASQNANIMSGVVNIRAEIKTFYPIQDFSVNINGAESSRETAGIVPKGENTYTFEKRIQLRAGKNTVYFSANNGKGVTKSVARIINFGIPPVIILTNPVAEDSINNSGLVTLIAEIQSSTPLLAYKIYHNGIPVLDEKGTTPEKKDSSTFILGSNLPLKKGFNTVYVEVKNALGTAVSEKRTINSHSEPFITWLLPASDNMAAKSGTLNIRTEIKTIFPLQNVRINVNGSFTSSDEKSGIKPLKNDTYLFEKAVQLKPGKNLIFISAGNAKGAIKSATRTINFGSEPVITVISPSSRDSLNNSGVSLVRAEIVSYTPLQTFRIVNNEVTAVSETMMKPEQKDSITYIIGTNVPLRKGLNTIYIEVKNALGTSSSETHNIISQSEPFISWLSPAAVSSEASTGTVNIKAEIRSFLDLQNVRLNLNGTILPPKDGELTRMNDGTYVFERTLQEALATKNTFFITASNIRGTTTSDSRSLNYSSGSKPVVTIISTDSLNNSGIILFTAEIVSRTKLQAIRVIQNGAVLANESAKIPDQKDSITYVLRSLIPLRAGQNTFFVEAKNSFGTASSGRRTIICQPEPIINWISPSSVTSTDGTGTVKIKAEIITSFDLQNSAINLNGAVLAEKQEGITRVNNEKYILEQDVSLKSGENSLILTAANARGTGYSSRRNVTYVPGVVSENIQVSPAVTEDKKVPETIVADKQVSPPPEIKQQEDKKITETVVAEKEVPPAPEIIKTEPVIIPAAVIETPASPAIAPVVTWVSPSRPSTSINQNSAEIRATVKSADKLQSVLVYVNGIGSEETNLALPSGIQGEYSIKKTINLQPGDNTVYLSVTNSVGTIRSDDRLLTNPPASKPVITWAIPFEQNTSVSSDMIIVEACIKSAAPLKEAQIYVNGAQWASETVFSTPQAGDCNYRFTKSVLLKEGDNNVIINAINLAGSEMSERRTIRFQTGITEKRLALVIGNAEYANTLALKNPVNDANLIEGTLKTLGFEVIKSLNSKKAEMEKAIREFSEKLPDYNVALFYYAGHGIQVGGENYLIPIDAVLDKESDCQWEAVQVNTIVRQFEEVPENINIIILDACRDNPFKSWSRGAPQGFKMLNTVSGSFVAFATAEGATAADGLDVNGIYTQELVRQMVVPQSIFNVFVNTRNQVMKRTNNQQQPEEKNKLTGDFWFKK